MSAEIRTPGKKSLRLAPSLYDALQAGHGSKPKLGALFARSLTQGHFEAERNSDFFVSSGEAVVNAMLAA
jgi:hypothetical protein